MSTRILRGRFIWPEVIRMDYRDGDASRPIVAEDIPVGLPDGRLLTIRRGFVHDWASIPRLLQWFAPATGDRGTPCGRAALMHDWLYGHQKIAGQSITRKEADDLFRWALRFDGVGAARAYAMWSAVRVGGSWGWRDRAPCACAQCVAIREAGLRPPA